MMEKSDSALIKSLDLSPFDERLRTARIGRLNLYNKVISLAFHKKIFVDENFALELFNHCQKIAFNKCGFSYETGQPDNPKITALIQEALA
jgi:hypothetical protein